MVIDFVGPVDQAQVSIDQFEVGTTSSVIASFNATCCIREATLKLLDVAGNANPKRFYLGPLRGKVDRRQCAIMSTTF